MFVNIKKYILPIVFGIIVIIFGLFISNHFGLYERVENLDKVFHFLGGVVLGWFFYRYFSSGQTRLTSMNMILVCVSVVCFFGVIWEFAERLSSVYSMTYFPWLFKWFHGGTINDSLLDLVADMVGGLVFVVASLATKINSQK